jgi:DNA-binding response OmpR family regulator
MSKKKILVIEDEEVCVKLLDLVVDKDAYAIIIARDGEEGIAKAKNEKPDLILLDIMLPKVNGYDVAKALRSEQGGVDAPIVVISARAGEQGRERALELGCQEFISKPFRVSQVRDVIDRYLG